MIEWHGSKAVGFLLRLGGAVLIGLAWLSVASLYSSVHAGERHDGTFAEYILGLAGFASASLGSLLLLVGPHLFDPIEVPALGPVQAKGNEIDATAGRNGQSCARLNRQLGRLGPNLAG